MIGLDHGILDPQLCCTVIVTITVHAVRILILSDINIMINKFCSFISYGIRV